jgi:hypothetical protein
MKPFTIQGLVTKILSVSPRFNTRVIEWYNGDVL